MECRRRPARRCASTTTPCCRSSSATMTATWCGSSMRSAWSCARAATRSRSAGPPSSVAATEAVLRTLYDKLKQGLPMGGGEVEGAIRMAAGARHRRCCACGRQRRRRPAGRARFPAHPAHPQAPGQPALAAPGRLCARHARQRPGVRARPRRHGKDLSRRGDGGLPLPRGPGRSHRALAARGRGRRAPRLPARRPEGQGRPLPPPALRRALRHAAGGPGGAAPGPPPRSEIAPLAFMRGRTLSQAFIILDEAQNTTPLQMKMFLTRLGERSRMVVTGDLTQVDLPGGRALGPAPRRDDARRAARGGLRPLRQRRCHAPFAGDAHPRSL